MKTTYTLGLDLGISSVGFALIDEKAQKIIQAGSHIFPVPEDANSGKSLAAIRGEKRRQRRTIDRRARRKRHLKYLFEKYQFSFVGFNDICLGKKGYTVWNVRAEALDRVLSEVEFYAVIFHIAAHRGFQSNKKEFKKEKTDESGRMKQGMSLLKTAMHEAGQRTIGEYLSKQNKQHNNPNEYDHTIERALLIEEAQLIFDRQRILGLTKASPELETEYLKIAFTQRPLKSTEKFIGKCSFMPDKDRAPKFSPSAERFIFLSNLNRLEITHAQTGEIWPINSDLRQAIIQFCETRKETHYSDLRAKFEIPEDYLFNVIRYDKLSKRNASGYSLVAEKSSPLLAKFSGLQALHKALGEQHGFTQEVLDDLARIISFNHEEGERAKKLKEKHPELSEQQTQQLSSIDDFNSTINLSLDFLYLLMPFLEQGLRYDQAVAKIDLKHYQPTPTSEGEALLSSFVEITNPVVSRALSQARKVINQIIQRFGAPTKIRIELAREISQSSEKRAEIERDQVKNKKTWESLGKQWEDSFGHPASYEDKLKLKLYQEQNKCSAYSGKPIPHELLNDRTALQIDHILPYSESFDDSQMNKVLCFTAENQRKKNHIPREFLDDQEFAMLKITFDKAPKAKKDRLFRLSFDSQQKDEWKNRNLVDTSYLSLEFKNRLERDLRNEQGEAIPVECVKGRITAMLRGKWLGDFVKDREDLRHHALDAMVIACTNISLVQKVTDYLQNFRLMKNKGLTLPTPWEGYREHVIETYNAIFVSQACDQKVSGAFHNETLQKFSPDLKAQKEINGIVKNVLEKSKVKLEKLNLTEIELLHEKHRNQKLYQVLHDRLKLYDDNAKKAFATPIYMPTLSGIQGPRIYSVVLDKPSKTSVMKLSKNRLVEGMDHARLDVFTKVGKYFLVPIRIIQFAQGELPNRAINAYKDEEEWTLIDESFQFCFSLYPNSLMHIIVKSREIWGYYCYVNTLTGYINYVEHNSGDRSKAPGTGVKLAKTFEKYNVNIFGEKVKVDNEQRVIPRKKT